MKKTCIKLLHKLLDTLEGRATVMCPTWPENARPEFHGAPAPEPPDGGNASAMPPTSRRPRSPRSGRASTTSASSRANRVSTRS